VKLRTVITSPKVRAQIQEQMLYIAQDSIENAFAWQDRVIAAVGKLESTAVHAIDQDASERVGFAIRKLVFEGTYLIFYHVDEAAGEVRVVNFRHGARLPLAEEP
jgi:plasmid stabilization system protein ParE